LWIVLVAVTIINLGVALLALRKDRETHQSRAAHWSLAPIAIGALAIAALIVMTFHTIDNQVKQKLADLGNISQAIGSSVAPAKVIDDENAAILYRQANLLLGGIDSYNSKRQNRTQTLNRWFQQARDAEPIDVTPELSSALAELEDVFRLLHLAKDRRGCNVIRNFARPNWGEILPELNWSYRFAELLYLSSLRAAADEDWDRAILDAETLFRMVEHNLSEPAFQALVTSTAIDARYSVRALQHLLQNPEFPVEKLNGLTIRTGLYETALHKSLLFTEAEYFSMLSDIAVNDLWEEYFEPFGLEGDIVRMPMSFYRVFYAMDDINRIRGLSGIAQLGDFPLYSCAEQLREHERSLHDGLHFFRLIPPFKGFWVRGNGDDTYTMFFKRAYVGVTWRKLALIAVAIRKYEVDHGRPPSDLKALGAVLETDIQDPFTGKDLIYKTTDNGWFLSSVGPNRTDDSGTSGDSNDSDDLIWRSLKITDN